MTDQVGYKLHPTLAEDTFPVCKLDLCEVRLMNDTRFPWLILVPMVEAAREIHQLDREDQRRLIDEGSLCAGLLAGVTDADKINVGALGNLVPQLHWHIVARRKEDACWPGPVWGCGETVRYRDGGHSLLTQRLLDAGLARFAGR